jgi:hypothetical protein
MRGDGSSQIDRLARVTVSLSVIVPAKTEEELTFKRLIDLTEEFAQETNGPGHKGITRALKAHLGNAQKAEERGDMQKAEKSVDAYKGKSSTVNK